MSTKTVMDRMKWTTTVVLAACLLGAAEHVRIWRRPLRKTLVGVAVVMTLSAAVVSEAQDKRAMVYGFGLKSCGQFVEARLEAQQSPYSPYSPYTDSPYISWLGGFLTATSTWLAATRTEPPETDVSAATIWIENYCRQNPLQQFHTAAVALVHHMTVTQAPAVRSAR